MCGTVYLLTVLWSLLCVARLPGMVSRIPLLGHKPHDRLLLLCAGLPTPHRPGPSGLLLSLLADTYPAANDPRFKWETFGPNLGGVGRPVPSAALQREWAACHRCDFYVYHNDCAFLGCFTR